MRLIVFGSGSIAKQHQKNLNELNYEVVSIRERETISFLTTNELIPKDDLCVICTSTYLHDEIVYLLCKKEIPFYCEKPFLLKKQSLEIYEDLKFRKTLKKSCIGFNLRYHPGLQALKDIIKKHKCKDLSFEINVCSDVTTWRQNRPIEELYSLDDSRGGGALSELSHELDYATFIFGELEVEYVSSISDPWLGRVDGSSKILLKSDRNIHGCISVNIVSPILNRFISISAKDLYLNLNLVSGKLTGEIYKEIINEEFIFDRNESLKQSLFNFIKFNKGQTNIEPVNQVYKCTVSSKVINEAYNRIAL